jgi:drug/metabolite transporter (DMT)-like permease
MLRRQRRRFMSPASPLLIPLGSALGYAVAALMLKRGTEGAGPWRVAFFTNGLAAILFSLLWLWPADHPISMRNVLHAAITGACFFVGQVFTFLALSRGDVSVATPVLGSKIIFVALFTVLLGTGEISGTTWLAVLLTAAATALLGGGGTTHRGALFRSLLYGFCAAAAFALTDVTQQHWVQEWGFFHYIPTMFLSLAFLSLGLLPFFIRDQREVSGASWRWMASGGVVLSLQAFGMAWSICTIGATTTNVLYNSRGVWSVVLVWSIGHWFGNEERTRGRAVMLRRLFGSLLLLGAIALITSKS